MSRIALLGAGKPPAAGGGGGGVTSISFVTSATSGTSGVTCPTVSPGDVLVMIDTAEAGTVPTGVVPTGFTQINNINDGSNYRQISSYKVASGSEDGTTITGMNGAFSNDKIIMVFRGDTAIASVTVVDSEGQVTSGNPTAQVVSASGGTPPLVVIGSFVANNAIDPRSSSPATDAEINYTFNKFAYAQYKIYNSSPADHTFDMDDEGTNLLQGFALAVA